jgi:hypothetical protein
MNRKDAYLILALFTDVLIVISYEAFGNGRLFQDYTNFSQPVGAVFNIANGYLGIVAIIAIYRNRDKVRKFMGVQ